MQAAVRLKSHSHTDGVREDPKDPRRPAGNCRSKPAYQLSVYARPSIYAINLQLR
jgi:hypothetical protein